MSKPLLQERVLLAERALLYAFAFDFRPGDPYSFALKYQRGANMGGEAETAFLWLSIAGQATTLCLQYPPSTIAVASLWYTQHLLLGEVSHDQNSIFNYVYMLCVCTLSSAGIWLFLSPCSDLMVFVMLAMSQPIILLSLSPLTQRLLAI